jgi:hypothetical protein
MKIVHIFEGKLFTFHYLDEAENELKRLLNLWNDSEYLYQFVNENKKDTKNIPTEALIEQIKKDAAVIDEILYKLATSNVENLDIFFKQLDNKEYQVINLSKRKGRKNYLRLYALKIDTNCFVITGGAIKFTLLMEEREHTKKELQKLDKCRQFLKNNGIFDSDSFFEFLNETK